MDRWEARRLRDYYLAEAKDAARLYYLTGDKVFRDIARICIAAARSLHRRWWRD